MSEKKPGSEIGIGIERATIKQKCKRQMEMEDGNENGRGGRRAGSGGEYKSNVLAMQMGK